MAKLIHPKTRRKVVVPDARAGYFTDKGWRVVQTTSGGDGPTEPNESWKVDELKAYAAEHDIDLGDATKKADIVAAIAGAAGSGGDGPTESE